MILPNKSFFQEVEAQLAEDRKVRFHIKGHSMRPLLRSERDIIVLKPFRGDVLRPGDIVLFRYKSRHILHRIIRQQDNLFTLSGDGNHRLTEQCTRADIAGIAMQVIRPSGRSISCQSRRWRWQSHCWLALPASLRHFLLRILWILRCR